MQTFFHITRENWSLSCFIILKIICALGEELIFFLSCFFLEGPTLTVVQSEILVGLGDTTVMECKTTGIPPPQVKWFKGVLVAW